MATKGPCNHFGNARGGRQGVRSEHIGYAWAKRFNPKTLTAHFKKHGMQMLCASEEEYNAKAVKFANYIDRQNCVSFVDVKGRTYKYNKKTNELAIITRNGTIETYYKPSGEYDYYLNQRKEKRK